MNEKIACRQKKQRGKNTLLFENVANSNLGN